MFVFFVPGDAPAVQRKRRARAHNFSCRVGYGEPQEGREVARHSCLDKSCINPAHLQWGSHDENRQDTVDADRQAKGQGNGRVKLTDEQVLDVIARVRGGETIHPVMLARALKVDPKAIRQIRDRKTWLHLWDQAEART